METTNFDTNRILIVKSGVLIDSVDAIQTISELRKHMTIELPDLVKGYFENRYEPNAEIAKEVGIYCESIIQKLYDGCLIAPLVDAKKCFDMVCEYLTHVLNLKSRITSAGAPDKEVISSLMESFAGRENPFLNIKDLKSVFDKSVVPENFVIWVESKGDTKRCICYSEFDATYRFLCVYQ